MILVYHLHNVVQVVAAQEQCGVSVAKLPGPTDATLFFAVVQYYTLHRRLRAIKGGMSATYWNRILTLRTTLATQHVRSHVCCQFKFKEHLETTFLPVKPSETKEER
jgi:hypothetical protein